MPRIAIYARISPGGRDSENQLIDLRQFVERKKSDDWVLVHEYVDNLVSGKTSDRPQFKKMFEAANNREFDILLFWALDRLSREGVYETLQHLQKLSNNKIEWYSYKEEYLRSVGMFRDVVLSILACIAKQERIRISERTIVGMKRAKAEGKVIGRPKVDVNKLRVREDHKNGMSFGKIAKKYGIGVGTAFRICEFKVS